MRTFALNNILLTKERPCIKAMVDFSLSSLHFRSGTMLSLTDSWEKSGYLGHPVTLGIFRSTNSMAEASKKQKYQVKSPSRYFPAMTWWSYELQRLIGPKREFCFAHKCMLLLESLLWSVISGLQMDNTNICKERQVGPDCHDAMTSAFFFPLFRCHLLSKL